MMSVNVPEANVDELLKRVDANKAVSIACINSPFNVTLSGDEADIDKIEECLKDDGIFAQKLNTGVAYHSNAMRQIAADYLDCLAHLENGDNERNDILMVSSITGETVPTSIVSKGQYWVNNLVSPVRFSDALHYLAVAAPKAHDLKSISDYLEVGPHGALRRPIIDTLSQVMSRKGFRYTSLLSRFKSPMKTVLDTTGRLFTHGYPVSLLVVNQQDNTTCPAPFLVDTPQYPFDHSKLYWHETRLSRDWRLREAVNSTLLGLRVTDWNPLEPRWRKTLTVDEMPWIADHVVGDTILFPATGTLMIALEAIRQESNDSKVIKGYKIEEATFTSPIVVRPGGTTELITHLRKIQRPYEKTSQRFQVEVFTELDKSWHNNFQSVIHVEYEDDLKSDFDNVPVTQTTTELQLADDYEHARSACINRVSKRDFYKWHHQQGLKYGEAFRLANDVYWDGDKLGIACADVGPPMKAFGGIVHPTVLDALCQVCYMAPSSGMSKALPTIIPHKIHDAWISATGWQYPQTSCVRMLTTSVIKLRESGINSSFTALNDNGSLLCHVKRLEMLPAGTKELNRNGERKFLHSIDWKPQLSLLSPAQIQSICEMDWSPSDETVVIDHHSRLERALRTVLQHSIHELLEINDTKATPHIRKYVSWMGDQLRQFPGQTKEEIREEALHEELEDLCRSRPSCKMVIEIARNIQSIVRGETNVLDLIFSTNLAQEYYAESISRMYDQRMVTYFQLLSHQTPGQKILEVGAGTGSLTSHVLSTLQGIEGRTGGIAFAEYAYTDVSPAFFEKARERFASHQERMKFRTLDLEEDVTSQGYERETYDVVLAGSVLHATKNLAATLRNLRQVLKPGGHLIFHETTAPSCFVMGFSFGVLPGWWRSEEKFRARGPTITESKWDVLLRDNGFTGNDLAIRDYQDDAAHYYSIIASSVEHAMPVSTEKFNVLVVVDDGNNYQSDVASALVDVHFNSSEYQPQVIPFSQLVHTKQRTVDCIVFLTDMGRSMLAQLSEPAFKCIQSCVQLSKGLLWVTSSDTATRSGRTSHPHPYHGLKDGFLRALRSEFNNKRIVSLSLEDTRDMSNEIAQIAKVFALTFRAQSPEVEYVVRDGLTLTGRMVEEVAMNKDLNSSIVPQVRIEPWAVGPPLKLDIGSRGLMDTMRFVEDYDHNTPLGPHDVEIEAKAWGVNFRDIFLALGRLDEDGLGSDCTGIVTRAGSQCKLRPGDRVCTAIVGCMRMYPRGEEDSMFKIPDSLSFDEACATIYPGLTAWYSLVDIARLQKGEKVLIHAASGGTGQVAIQVAQMLGAEVFATVGYDHKKKLLIEKYGIPEDHIFYSRNTDFAKGIMRVTGGYGVDIVLNSLVGEGLRASWECIAAYGRFIEIGKADINANASLPMAGFARNVTFSAVDLHHVSLYNKGLGRRLLHKVVELIKDGSIYCPKPLHLYGLDEVQDAFRYLQSGKNTGRIIIKVDRSTKVKKHLINHRNWSFDSEATYLIAGGLGGIGRSMLKWMASKGAKNLIVPSRSGVASRAAVEVVDELVKQGIKVVAPKCDVSSRDSLLHVIEDSTRAMPPIRGCINAAMVLQDSIFENMTHAQWERTIRSKVDSSWNLHALLPKELDFFVLLSSIAGVIGNPGQSNYAAGCTFQDSLARYRNRNGQRAASIDLGLMRTIGIIAESGELYKKVEVSQSLGQIEEEELLALLDMCCCPSDSNITGGMRGQIMMGLVTPVDILYRGLEPEEVMQRPLFGHFSRLRGTLTAASSATNTINFASLFRQAESAEQRTRVVVELLVMRLARTLSVKPEDVDADQPLHAFGVDSLVAVELRNLLMREFAADVPNFEIMGGRTITAVAELAVKLSTIPVQVKNGA
ncbi:hypothetical protein SLS62_000674 [Diatrype stigma]|uniref:Carrier domain-containing protein n=1 Tax=Diatrype stigma TaxID=117547 RepID=A0AAN9YWF4_9PEZI